MEPLVRIERDMLIWRKTQRGEEVQMKFGVAFPVSDIGAIRFTIQILL